MKEYEEKIGNLSKELDNTKHKLVEEEKKVIQMNQMNSGSEGIINELRNFNSKLETNIKENKEEENKLKG